MRNVKIDPEKTVVGTKHYLTAGGINYPYHVVAVWGADTFAPIVEPLVVAECRMKGVELPNPFLTLPLSVFAELFQYSDEAFWKPANTPTIVRFYADGTGSSQPFGITTYPTEGQAESVPE